MAINGLFCAEVLRQFYLVPSLTLRTNTALLASVDELHNKRVV